MKKKKPIKNRGKFSNKRFEKIKKLFKRKIIIKGTSQDSKKEYIVITILPTGKIVSKSISLSKEGVVISTNKVSFRKKKSSTISRGTRAVLKKKNNDDYTGSPGAGVISNGGGDTGTPGAGKNQ